MDKQQKSFGIQEINLIKRQTTDDRLGTMFSALDHVYSLLKKIKTLAHGPHGGPSHTQLLGAPCSPSSVQMHTWTASVLCTFAAGHLSPEPPFQCPDWSEPVGGPLP